MEDSKLIDTLRTRNHELISSNAQLFQLVVRMEENFNEQERYVRYLESLLNEMGWIPGKEKQC